MLPIQNIIPEPLFYGRNKVNPLKEVLTQCHQAGREYLRPGPLGNLKHNDQVLFLRVTAAITRCDDIFVYLLVRDDNVVFQASCLLEILRNVVLRDNLIWKRTFR